jgi:hypothetical protein
VHPPILHPILLNHHIPLTIQLFTIGRPSMPYIHQHFKHHINWPSYKVNGTHFCSAGNASNSCLYRIMQCSVDTVTLLWLLKLLDSKITSISIWNTIILYSKRRNESLTVSSPLIMSLVLPSIAFHLLSTLALTGL